MFFEDGAPQGAPSLFQGFFGFEKPDNHPVF
jgi:hypothetical protein